jgi:hypothetical protein
MLISSIPSYLILTRTGRSRAIGKNNTKFLGGWTRMELELDRAYSARCSWRSVVRWDILIQGRILMEKNLEKGRLELELE